MLWRMNGIHVRLAVFAALATLSFGAPLSFRAQRGIAFVPTERPTPARQAQSSARDSLVITYLANEGVMLSSGGATVLIDALFGEGLRGYGVVSKPTRVRLEGATAPFDRVSAVLTTHIHPDHFDASGVAAHLGAHGR